MGANTLLTSVITGGTNSHTTVAEEANALATDFVSNGVVGAISLNTGSGGTGSFCVNADASPDMGVTIKAGQAYVTATPSSQNSQVLRVRAAADYTTYTINSNASGSTKYDWIYLSISATNANQPSADGSNVASFVTSRSSSNTTDNGSPPTYGLLLAIVTVANAASSITNSNITDKRYNASNGAQNGSLVVQQNGTGTDAKIQAAGIDANVNLDLRTKGTGVIEVNGTQIGPTAFKNPYKFSVYLAASQTGIADSTVTKILFDTEEFDTNNNFASSTYTVPVSGFYQINAYVEVESAANNGIASQLYLYKNGAAIKTGGRLYPSISSTVAVDIPMNISTLVQLTAGDTLDIRALFDVNSGTVTAIGGATISSFSGYLVSVL